MMRIHFKDAGSWLEGCYQLMTKGAQFEAFPPDGECAMYYIDLTGGY